MPCSVCGLPTVGDARFCTRHRPRFDTPAPTRQAAEREAEERLAAMQRREAGPGPREAKTGQGQRQTSCLHYDDCLDLACRRDWLGFDCSACALRGHADRDHDEEIAEAMVQRGHPHGDENHGSESEWRTRRNANRAKAAPLEVEPERPARRRVGAEVRALLAARGPLAYGQIEEALGKSHATGASQMVKRGLLVKSAGRYALPDQAPAPESKTPAAPEPPAPPAEEETVADVARIAELDEQIAEMEQQLAALREERRALAEKRLAEIEMERARLLGVVGKAPEPKPAPKVAPPRPGTTRAKILDRIRTSKEPVRAKDLEAEFGHCSSTLTEMERNGQVVRAGRGFYRAA